MNMINCVLSARVTFIVSVSLCALSVAAQEKQEKKESYVVGAGANVTVTNDCGPITVMPSPTGKVLVTVVWHSASVRFLATQRGDRLDLRATSNSPGVNLAEYSVLVPPANMVTVRSSNGDLHVQGLRGDVALETSTSAITVSDMADAHLRARTLSGTISLKDVDHSHIDVYSVRGDIHLHDVRGSWLAGHSASGRITYDGDPGLEGEYLLSSHFGDLEVSIPSSASVEIKTRSLKGGSDQEVNFPVHPPASTSKNSFLKSARGNASRFKLHSLRGDIRITRP
jgi:hypothetical protein